jgi:putative drug exporter of the RND superfamily
VPTEARRPAPVEQRQRAVTPPAPTDPEPVKSGRPSRAFAWAVGFLRFPIVLGLLVAALASLKYLPGVSSLGESGVRALLPERTAAVEAEAEAARLFGSSLLPRTLVVQRDPNGLSRAQQRRTVRMAARLDEDKLARFPRGSRALPYLNTKRLLPGSRESSTTAITFLGFPASLTPQDQRKYADRYAGALSLPGAKADATGFIPGSVTQSIVIGDGLIWVELATVLLVALILGLYLRSLLAPLVTLAAAGIAYLISIGVVSYLAETQSVELEREVEPIVVVLLLGVVTDYSVFFLSGMRGRLAAGENARDAATRATAQVIPIVFTAGLLVAAGLVTLRLASIGFVQTLGPAMAVVVLVSLAVSITFVPASMRILGRALFWPGLAGKGEAEPMLTRLGGAIRRGVAIGASRRLFAVPAAFLVLVGLVVATAGLASTRLALTPIRGLASDSAPARAAAEAGKGFTPGIVAPTEIVLEAPGIGGERRKLRRFARALAAEPDVGAVLGAGMASLPERFRLAFHTRSGGAVRYYVAFRHHPYSAAAVADLGRLQEAMPRLLERTGLSRATVLYAGDTALARETIARVYRDLLWVGLAAALVNLVLLSVFLRSLVAPILLVASSALAIAATFGLTTLIFRDLFATPELTYFVPLAVGVLLLSFGTDYNLFVVGRIWQEARDTHVTDAVRVAVPRASRAISVAGLALAGSFAMLAIVPVAPFREFAVAIGIGILIDTFIVRTLLIPALLTSLGDRSWWPSGRGRRAPARDDGGGRTVLGGHRPA